MSGKKFISIFLVIMVVSAVGLSLWIKQGYDSRPAAKVDGAAVTESCAAAKAVMNQFIELDYNGKTTARSADVELTRESVVAGCREDAPDQVEVIVAHAVYGSLASGYTKEEVEKVLMNEPKQTQSRVSLINRSGAWTIEPATVYGPHVSVEAARAQAR